MVPWQGWPAERVVFVFLGVAYLVIWAQLTLLHWRGGFRSKAMWGPVFFTPIAVIAALTYGFVRAEWSQMFFVISFWIAVLEGVGGLIMHLKGISALVGGFTLRNIASGPPPLLPLAYAALGAFGLIVNAVAPKPTVGI